MKSLINLYRNAYGGLSKETWVLSTVMFINRSGSMVLPFLSLYLTESLGYGLKDAGLIISLFGAGSMAGSFLGGFLTDRYGHFWVQFLSLIGTSILFLLVLNTSDFRVLLLLIFILAMTADTLRPANSASIASYARPENMTRAFSLNRMAVNLGFSIGPAIGGILAGISYHLLFIGDSVTCFIAGVVFYVFFRNRKTNTIKKETSIGIISRKSVLQDWPFLIFVFLTTCYAVTLFQIFTTLPLYYRDIYHLSETTIGLLIGVNGLFIFFVEMIFVYLIGDKIRFSRLIVFGVVLTGLSFAILNWFQGIPLLFCAIILLSIAEVMVMPYLATLVSRRADSSNMGSYMGLYTFAYSIALVLAPYLGTRIIVAYGYDALWYAVGGLSIFTAIGFMFLLSKLKK